MALIKISNLNADLSASESFLTELQLTDSSQIFGGTSYGHGGKEKEKEEKEKKDKEHKGSNDGYGNYCPPSPCYSCH